VPESPKFGKRRLEEVSRSADLPTGERVPHGVLEHAVVGVPLAGGAVQGEGAARVLVKEPSPERLREQVVVAVPGALVVERDYEQVAALELLQHGAAVVASSEGVAE
jgi:hypothetical protein